MPIYSSIYSGPPNNYGATVTVKKYIVIHNTSNDASAENEASYAKRRTDSVSSHYYVDNDSIIQSLNTDYRAFHVGSKIGNSAGIAYEITGVNAKTRSWWLENVAWELLAKQIRLDCKAHNITPRLLTVDQIKNGSMTGIMTHNQARLAWGGTDHTDPGPNFPLDHLLKLVTEEEDDMPTVREVWHTDGLIDAPSGAADRATNPTWAPASAIRGTLERVYHLPSELRAIKTEQAAAKLREEAILAAVKGLDTKAVIAAVNARASEDAARDAALRELVQAGLSGNLDAAEVVQRMGQLLSGAGE
jgi:hypothetical protein